MKKLLPPIPYKSAGFTLVELMVVIAILAILAVVGISVYSGAQKNARDAKRRADVDQITKSIEAYRDVTLNSYSYASTNFDADFPSTKPGDPSGSQYCVKTDDAAPVADALTTGTSLGWATDTGNCANGWALFSSSTGLAATGGITGKKYWKVCAKLEVSGSAYCKGSLIR